MPGDICPEGLQVAPGPSGRDEARDRTRSRKPSPELGEDPKKTPPPPGHAEGEPDDGGSVSCFYIICAGAAGIAPGGALFAHRLAGRWAFFAAFLVGFFF